MYFADFWLIFTIFFIIVFLLPQMDIEDTPITWEIFS